MPNIAKIEWVLFSPEFIQMIKKNIHWYSLLKSVKPILMPIVWFDDEARITSDVHSELSTLIVFLNISYYVKFILPALSLLFIALTSSYIYFQVRISFFEIFVFFDRLFLVAKFSTSSSKFENTTTQWKRQCLRENQLKWIMFS